MRKKSETGRKNIDTKGIKVFIQLKAKDSIKQY
jgi:hypothetical protein